MKLPKRRRGPSPLRWRFALWSALLVFFAIGLYGLFVYFTTELFLNASVRDSLRFNADQVIKTLEVDEGRFGLPENWQLSAADLSGGSEVSVRLYDAHLRQIAESGPLAGLLAVPPGFPDRTVFVLGEPDLATLTVPVKNHDQLVGVVQLVQSTEPLEKMLKQLLIILAASLPMFVVASIIGGVFLAGRLLKPIDAMTTTARRFSTEDLSARIGLPPRDDELGRLAATFDQMLARIEESFTKYRQFTADASHELRTPVSVIQAILEVTKRRSRTIEEYQGAMADLEGAARRLENLVSALMTMSRTDRNIPPADAVVDVGDLLWGCVESLRPLADQKGLVLNSQIEPQLLSTGDGDALIHGFVNVIDNAIKYTAAGSVTVRGFIQDPNLVIEVTDTGMGIGEDELTKIFDRFYRVEKSRSGEGTGLGLSIAQAVVLQHRGSIQAESRLGQGTTLRILLPRHLP